jgi:hypothetical protein
VEPGTPDGHTPEGVDPVTDPVTVETIIETPKDPDIDERTLPFVDPHREGRGVERVVRWTRTVIIEGPQDWVRETWDRALADGVHIVGSKRGIQCRIEASTEGWQSVRGLHGPTSNAAMEAFRQASPEIYDGVHGDGAAKAHAPNNDSQDQPKTTAAHVGQYL